MRLRRHFMVVCGICSTTATMKSCASSQTRNAPIVFASLSLDDAALSRILAAYCFPVVVECSLRFGFSGSFLRGLRPLNAPYELLSLAVFVRLGTFSRVFHSDSPTG